MLIITCSTLLIELLDFFLSNSIMMIKTDFLLLIKKYLFLTILSSFQNQKFKIYILKNQIQILLQIIFNTNMRWISNDQKIAVIVMLENWWNILVILISSSEKNFLIIIFVFFSWNQIIVVIIFFIALHDDLQTQCQFMKMHMLIWNCNIIFIIFLVLIISELAMSEKFQTYLQKLIQKKHLAYLMFDEYHVIMINDE